MSEVPEIPYVVEEPGELELERTLRSGPDMLRRDVVEHFETRSAGAHQLALVRQESPSGTADVHVVYDAHGLPIRVWRRFTTPSSDDPVGRVDLRVYALGGDEVRLARLNPDGSREGAGIPGPRPRVVIGPGRGLLSVWIQRAHLEVGGRLRESALDVTEPLAVLRDVTLIRHEGREVEGLGLVRVYTIYGREPVFTDEDDVIVGDLLGLREASTVAGPLPDPMPDPGPFDPRILP